MEVGKAGQLSTYEKEYYMKKVIGLSITAFLLIFLISFFIIVNYTSLLERKIFEGIADRYGYTLSYSNTYELLSSKNADQGNYIQLSDPDNQIYILFRFDETSTKLVEIFDDVTDTKSLYAVTTTVDDKNKLRSEEEILYNIDKEFNPLNSTSVKGNANNIGGGYSIVKLDTVMNQHRIEYMSNLLRNISNHSTKNDKNNTMASDDVLAVKNWFNYSNSINYQLGILKAIVETEAQYDNEKEIIYSGGGSSSNVTIFDNVGDSTDPNTESTIETSETTEEETNNTIDKSLEGFINNKDDILKEYGNVEFSTYTSLILSNSNTSEALFNDKKSQVEKPNGIIIGTCVNKAESVEKMSTTMNLLIIISYLERTILL